MDSPHLAYPLRLTNLGAVCFETDSEDDLISTAFYAYRTPPGYILEAPGFGVDDPVFDLSPGSRVVRQLEQSDPRLSVQSIEQWEQRVLHLKLLISGAAS
jgi:hypothetical protein